MSQTSAEATALVPAAPEQVIAVLRDYETHHPRILPEQYFTDFRLEQGGQGAGTVFRLKTRTLGQERAFHMRVSEPEAGVGDTGYRLVETDIDTGMETTFTVTPAAGGSRVMIATRWQPAGGLAGWLERLFTPALMRKMYTAELEKLAAYVQNVHLDGYFGY